MKLTGLHPINTTTDLPLPLYGSLIAAGFPSPADDYLEDELNLIEHLIRHPAATFYGRAQGDSMTGAGIYDGDLLIVDRSLTAVQGDTVIAALDGELCCKILDLNGRRLLSANEAYPPLPIPDGSDLDIEGVVIHAIHHFRWR